LLTRHPRQTSPKIDGPTVDGRTVRVRVHAERAGKNMPARPQIETGVLRYYGVDAPRLIMLYGTFEGTAECEAVVAEARALGAEF
jgi:hypothetical protein